MRILGIGQHNYLGDLYRRLTVEGHETRVFIEHPGSQRVMSGMVARCDDWRAELDWVRRAGEGGVVVFESACQGELQDQLRRDGFKVIGGSAFGDRLESDRAFGQQILREAGVQTAATHSFDTLEQAIAFVRERPARYVYKLCGSQAASTRNYVGQLEDGSDVIGMLRMEDGRAVDDGLAVSASRFVLMEHVSGVEVGVGAYFDGRSFLKPACLDWEHKHFFPNDLGELTGEMGTVVTYRGAERLFDLTLGRMEELLRVSGYCGYINLNTIVNEAGIWPLEFTCRFGYPGYSICAALHRESWAIVFKRMLRQLPPASIATRSGFSVGVVLTVPPFPYADASARDAPVFFREPLDTDELDRLHLGDIALVSGQMVVCGGFGEAMVVTGIGEELVTARDSAYRLARKLVVPNLRYRADIGDKLLREDLNRLASLGFCDVGQPSNMT
ncbi:MAG: phosphoribosylamine--glycine ligase [Panacagrimonas sp.]